MIKSHSPTLNSKPEPLLRNPIYGTLLALGAGLLLTVSPLAASPKPWIITAGQLHQLDLETAFFHASYPTEVIGRVRALAQHPEGEIYALSETCCPSRQHLFAIEPTTGTTRPLGTLRRANAWIGGLAVDGKGGIWLAADGELWSIDPARGHEKRWAVTFGADQALLTVAAARGGLYGVTALPSRHDHDRSSWTEPRLVRIDVDQGNVHPLRRLQELRGDGVTSLAADATGRFWLLEVAYKSGVPAMIRHTFWRLDMASGGLLSRATVEGSEIGINFQAFTFENKTIDPPVAVPTLDTLGLILLGIFLAATAQLVTQRRRQQAAAQG